MRRVKEVSVTPTVGTDAYTAGDVVGGLMSFQFTGHHPFDGIIRSVRLVDDYAQSEEYTLYIFNQKPSTIADDAAFAPTEADLLKLVTTVAVATGDWAEINSNDWALLGEHEDTAMGVYVHSYNGYLYMYAQAADTPDYNAADDLTITMTVEIF